MFPDGSANVKRLPPGYSCSSGFIRSGDHGGQRGLRIVRSYQRQNAGAVCRRGDSEHATEFLTGFVRMLDAGVLGPVVGELPTQSGGVELLRSLQVVNGKFDVIDHVRHHGRLRVNSNT